MEDKAVFYEYYSVTSLEKGSKYRNHDGDENDSSECK